MDLEQFKARRRWQAAFIVGIAIVIVVPVMAILVSWGIVINEATAGITPTDLVARNTAVETEVSQTLTAKAIPIATSDAALDTHFRAQPIYLPDMSATAGTGKLTLNISLPKGYAFNNQAPFTLHIYNDQVVAVDAKSNDVSLTLPTMPIIVPITLKAGQTTLTMDSRVYYCEVVNESYCIPAQFRFIVPLTVTTGAGSANLQLDYAVLPPVIQ